MSNSNDIAIIVVTYNRKELLEKNIESISKQSIKNFDLILVNNNSNDGTDLLIEELLNKYDFIKYIKLEKNIGGAGGFNVGLRKAIEDGYKYAWVMDDDTIVSENGLEKIYNTAKDLNNDFSFLSSVVRWKDNSMCVMNIPDISQNFIREIDMVKRGLIKINSCSFVACFINLEIAKEVGLPIKEFFIYSDDVEYTIRLSNKKPGYIVLDSEVLHLMKSNGEFDNDRYTSTDLSRIDRMVYNYRNDFYINKKRGVKSTIRYLLRCFKHFFMYIIKSRKYTFKKIGYMIKGVFLGIFFNPKIEYADNIVDNYKENI